MAYAEINDFSNVNVYKDLNKVFHIQAKRSYEQEIKHTTVNTLIELRDALMDLMFKGYLIPDKCFDRIHKEIIHERLLDEIDKGKRKTTKTRTKYKREDFK